VRVWLDDFGTGYSSLSHLRRVQVDGLKIDRSFITDLLRDPDDLALTSAIIAMAHSMGIVVVAEGVEKQGQYELLRDRDCDLVQGYWLGHPITAAEFAKLLIERRAPPRLQDPVDPAAGGDQAAGQCAGGGQGGSPRQATSISAPSRSSRASAYSRINPPSR
jgi:predicted signal transduction protein with EAL and GGDEF domain